MRPRKRTRILLLPPQFCSQSFVPPFCWAPCPAYLYSWTITYCHKAMLLAARFRSFLCDPYDYVDPYPSTGTPIPTRYDILLSLTKVHAICTYLWWPYGMQFSHILSPQLYTSLHPIPLRPPPHFLLIRIIVVNLTNGATVCHGLLRTLYDTLFLIFDFVSLISVLLARY